jgi:hypothetical protein
MSNIIKSWNGKTIRICQNHYVSLTDMAIAGGKRFPDWYRLNSTKSYLTKLSSVIEVASNQLVIVQQGGIPENQGTWGHPMAAIEFGRWLSPEFGIWCNIHLQNVDFTNNFHADPTKLKSGFVYLAMTPNGWCKIGMSKQPEEADVLITDRDTAIR